jgi:hypothetical protein
MSYIHTSQTETLEQFEEFVQTFDQSNIEAMEDGYYRKRELHSKNSKTDYFLGGPF